MSRRGPAQDSGTLRCKAMGPRATARQVEAQQLQELRSRTEKAERRLLACENLVGELGNLLQDYGHLQQRLDNVENLLKNRNFWILRLPPGSRGEIPKVPLTFDDISVYFNEEEWERLERWQKDLYRAVMRGNYEMLVSLDYAISKPDILSRMERDEELCVQEGQELPLTDLGKDQELPGAPEERDQMKDPLGEDEFPMEFDTDDDVSTPDALFWMEKEEEHGVQEGQETLSIRIRDDQESSETNVPGGQESPQTNVPDGQKSPQTSVPDGQKSPQTNVPDGQKSPQTSVPDGQKSPQTSIPDGQKSPQTSIPDGQKSPQTSVPDGQKSPQTSVSDDQKSPQTSIPDGQKSPWTSVPDGPKSPRTNIADGQKSPRTSIPDGQKSPQTSVPDGQKSPQTSVPDGQKSPQTSVPDGQKSPQTSVPDGQKSPQTSVPDGQKSPQTSVPDGQKSPQTSVPDGQKSPQTSVPDGQKSPQTSIPDGQKSPQTPEEMGQKEKALGQDKVPMEANTELPILVMNVMSLSPQDEELRGEGRPEEEMEEDPAEPSPEESFLPGNEATCEGASPPENLKVKKEELEALQEVSASSPSPEMQKCPKSEQGKAKPKKKPSRCAGRRLLMGNCRRGDVREWSHPCTECGKRFRLKINLIIHQRSHAKEGPYECTACEISFTDRHRLDLHQSIHVKDRAFGAKVWGNVHPELRIRPRRKFQGAFCGDANGLSHETYSGGGAWLGQAKEELDRGSLPSTCFSRQQSPRSHRRPEAKCIYCKKILSCTSSLQRHLQTHLQDRPYCCAACNKCFTRRTHLFRHQKIHDRQKALAELHQPVTVTPASRQPQPRAAPEPPHSSVQESKKNVATKGVPANLGLLAPAELGGLGKNGQIWGGRSIQPVVRLRNRVVVSEN